MEFGLQNRNMRMLTSAFLLTAVALSCAQADILKNSLGNIGETVNNAAEGSANTARSSRISRAAQESGDDDQGNDDVDSVRGSASDLKGAAQKNLGQGASSGATSGNSSGKRAGLVDRWMELSVTPQCDP